MQHAASVFGAREKDAAHPPPPRAPRRRRWPKAVQAPPPRPLGGRPSPKKGSIARALQLICSTLVNISYLVYATRKFDIIDPNKWLI